MLNFPSLYQQPIKRYELIHQMPEVEEILCVSYSRDSKYSAHMLELLCSSTYCNDGTCGFSPSLPKPSSHEVNPICHTFLFYYAHKEIKARDPWVAQWFNACLWPRARSWRPGIESHHRAPGAWSLLLLLPMSLPPPHHK